MKFHILLAWTLVFGANGFCHLTPHAFANPKAALAPARSYLDRSIELRGAGTSVDADEIIKILEEPLDTSRAVANLHLKARAAQATLIGKGTNKKGNPEFLQAMTAAMKDIYYVARDSALQGKTLLFLEDLKSHMDGYAQFAEALALTLNAYSEATYPKMQVTLSDGIRVNPAWQDCQEDPVHHCQELFYGSFYLNISVVYYISWVGLSGMDGLEIDANNGHFARAIQSVRRIGRALSGSATLPKNFLANLRALYSTNTEAFLLEKSIADFDSTIPGTGTHIAKHSLQLLDCRPSFDGEKLAESIRNLPIESVDLSAIEDAYQQSDKEAPTFEQLQSLIIQKLFDLRLQLCLSPTLRRLVSEFMLALGVVPPSGDHRTHPTRASLIDAYYYLAGKMVASREVKLNENDYPIMTEDIRFRPTLGVDRNEREAEGYFLDLRSIQRAIAKARGPLALHHMLIGLSQTYAHILTREARLWFGKGLLSEEELLPLHLTFDPLMPNRSAQATFNQPNIVGDASPVPTNYLDIYLDGYRVARRDAIIRQRRGEGLKETEVFREQNIRKLILTYLPILATLPEAEGIRHYTAQIAVNSNELTVHDKAIELWHQAAVKNVFIKSKLESIDLFGESFARKAWKEIVAAFLKLPKAQRKMRLVEIRAYKNEINGMPQPIVRPQETEHSPLEGIDSLDDLLLAQITLPHVNPSRIDHIGRVADALYDATHEALSRIMNQRLVQKMTSIRDALQDLSSIETMDRLLAFIGRVEGLHLIYGTNYQEVALLGRYYDFRQAFKKQATITTREDLQELAFIGGTTLFSFFLPMKWVKALMPGKMAKFIPALNDGVGPSITHGILRLAKGITKVAEEAKDIGNTLLHPVHFSFRNIVYVLGGKAMHKPISGVSMASQFGSYFWLRFPSDAGFSGSALLRNEGMSNRLERYKTQWQAMSETSVDGEVHWQHENTGSDIDAPGAVGSDEPRKYMLDRFRRDQMTAQADAFLLAAKGLTNLSMFIPLGARFWKNVYSGTIHGYSRLTQRWNPSLFDIQLKSRLASGALQIGFRKGTGYKQAALLLTGTTAGLYGAYLTDEELYRTINYLMEDDEKVQNAHRFFEGSAAEVQQKLALAIHAGNSNPNAYLQEQIKFAQIREVLNEIRRRKEQDKLNKATLELLKLRD